MTRPPVMQTAFSLTGSIAIVKSIERLCRAHLPENWISQKNFEDSELVEVLQDISNAFSFHENVNFDESIDNLTWKKVGLFILQEILNLDIKISLGILLLLLLLPLLGVLLHAEITDDRNDDMEPQMLRHYDPAERALLQFGKNHSEPVLVKDHINRGSVSSNRNTRKNTKKAVVKRQNIDKPQEEEETKGKEDLTKEGKIVSYIQEEDISDFKEESNLNSDESPSPVGFKPSKPEEEIVQTGESIQDVDNIDNAEEEAIKNNETSDSLLVEHTDVTGFESSDNRLENTMNFPEEVPDLVEAQTVIADASSQFPPDKSSDSLPSIHDSISSHSNSAQLHVHPSKTTNLEGKVTNEQVFSQPFVVSK
ncbi:hypothetical protein NCAS_0A06330 [Naumovozyma castellii]|uniref:Uncharacterized protein n=1 Tax=Naumovozyma castellii TaxID=27288 RepID=G0V6U5_NAUCA|nr:hypothetical protein NCAS_0A06330 [Naumovozyma castellii CBS 4309]CCC67191.1 hypothetical protein NCAS_0A06330 [Naumovozyma castellii CBS 4309]